MFNHVRLTQAHHTILVYTSEVQPSHLLAVRWITVFSKTLMHFFLYSALTELEDVPIVYNVKASQYLKHFDNLTLLSTSLQREQVEFY